MEKEAAHTHTHVRRGEEGERTERPRSCRGHPRKCNNNNNNMMRKYFGKVYDVSTLGSGCGFGFYFGSIVTRRVKVAIRVCVCVVCDACQTVRHATRLTNLVIYCTKCMRR